MLLKGLRKNTSCLKKLYIKTPAKMNVIDKNILIFMIVDFKIQN